MPSKSELFFMPLNVTANTASRIGKHAVEWLDVGQRLAARLQAQKDVDRYKLITSEVPGRLDDPDFLLHAAHTQNYCFAKIFITSFFKEVETVDGPSEESMLRIKTFMYDHMPPNVTFAALGYEDEHLTVLEAHFPEYARPIDNPDS